MIEDTYIFNTNEELDSYFTAEFLSIDNQLKENEEEKITNKDYQIGLYSVINKDLKEVTKLGKSMEKSMKKSNCNICLYTILNKIFNNPDYTDFIEDNEAYLKIVDRIHLYLVTVNNMLASLTYYLVNHKYEVEEETSKYIFALWRLIMQAYGNIQVLIEEEMKRYEYAGKGISYFGKYEINIEYIFSYIFVQMKNVGIIEEIKQYFKDSFGEDYYILKMIKENNNNLFIGFK
ncbi:MAG: hypothetical protein ACI31M_01570 [Bacilli bacterium]